MFSSLKPPIGSACSTFDGTIRRTCQSSPLLLYDPLKEGLNHWEESPVFVKPPKSKSTLGGLSPQFSLQLYSREEGTPPLWSGCHQFWIQMQGCQMQSPKENI